MKFCQDSVLGGARSCVDVIEADGRFSILGLVGTREQMGTRIFSYPVLGTDNVASLLADAAHALVVVGQIKTPEPRIRVFKLLERYASTLPTIVSPHAYVSGHATIAAGTIVMHGAVVNAGAIVGRNCILNSLCLVEHDSVIGDHCHISTAAAVNSGVRIAAAATEPTN